MNFQTFLEKLECNTLSRKQMAKVAKQVIINYIQHVIIVSKRKSNTLEARISD